MLQESGRRTACSPDRFLRPARLTCVALILSLSQLFVAAGNAQPQDQPGKIPESPPIPVRGTVRNALTGEPLPRALVRVEGDANTGALTDGDGHFEFAVPPGPQSIRLQKPGYHDRSYASEDGGLDGQEGPPHSVMVSDDMPELEFKLTPSCVISGRIELSTGDPAQGMTIILLKQVIHSGRAVWSQVTNTRANGDGAYRFAGLPAGTYIVYTQPSLETEPAVTAVAAGQKAGVTRAGFPAVFFPDARDFAGAGHIQLSDGQQATANMLLTLEPFYSVSAVGVLASAANAAPPAGNNGVILDASGHLLPYTPQYDDATHSMQANLPDGGYILLLHGVIPPHFQVNGQGQVYIAGKTSPAQISGMIEFTVAGHPMDGLRIPLGPSRTTPVLVHYVHSGVTPVGSRPASNDDSNAPATVGAEQADGLPAPDPGGTVSSISPGADSIDLSVNWPGTYWLSAYIPQRNLCVDSLKAAGANLAREPISLSPVASAPPMELTLRDDCAQLALTLPQGLAQFEPGEEPFYTVYVVPDFDSIQDIPPMAMHASSGPTLNVDGLTPGSYHVYTFTSPVRLEYHSPAALAALSNPGQQITLAPGGSGSLVLEVPAQ